MKIRYVIKGTNRIGDKVRLFLSFDDVVKKSNKMSLLETIGMARDMEAMEKMQEEIQQKALLMQQPDCVTISYDEWQQYKYKIDDIIWVEIMLGDKVD
jgi:hypothetical protein